MSETIGEKLAYGKATAEAQEWAAVEGKHAEMHLLREAAIWGARAIMEQVGIKEVKDQDRGSARGIEVVRISGPITLASQSATIEESRRSYKITAPADPRGIRLRLSQRIAGHKPDPEAERSKLQLTIIKRNRGGREVSRTDMMSHPQLDVRPNLLWTPESMVDHYQSQADQLITFMGEVDHLALQTGTYIYSRHIGEYLMGEQTSS